MWQPDNNDWMGDNGRGRAEGNGIRSSNFMQYLCILLYECWAYIVYWKTSIGDAEQNTTKYKKWTQDQFHE